MKKRLLAVDGETLQLRELTLCLGAEGYEVTTARNGREALMRLNQTTPDLVITELWMPDLDGDALVRSLRANPRTALIPAIILTTKNGRDDRIAGFRLGADAYLCKPFDAEELLAVLTGIFARIERANAEFARLVGVAKSDAAMPVTVSFAEGFTDAETRVARAVARGLSNKEIAQALRLSVRTVEGHISNILGKKGWSNRVEIARHVMRRGFETAPRI